MVNVLAVRALAVIGESHVLWPYLEPGFRPAVESGVLSGVEIMVRPWDDSGHARGAATLALSATVAAR